MMMAAYAPKIPVNTNIRWSNQSYGSRDRRDAVDKRKDGMKMALETQRSLLTGSTALE